MGFPQPALISHGEVDALTAFLHRVGDYSRRFTRRCRRTVDQRTPHVGHDLKPGSRLARPGGLDRRIQRKAIDLKSGLIDGLTDFGNIAGRLLDRIHRRLYEQHLYRTGPRRDPGLHGRLPLRFGIVRIPLGHA